jgi:hypothetical protein
MTKRPLLIVPAILILLSLVLSIVALYSRPSPSVRINYITILPIFCCLFVAANLGYLAKKKVKAGYWGASIVALTIAYLPQQLIAITPHHTHLLVVATFCLDAISASALYLSFRRDTFDLSLWENNRRASKSSYILKLIILLIIIVGMFWYYSRA